MASEIIFTNADIVLADRVLRGSLVVRNGRIAEIDEGLSRHGEDLGGDVLLPGLVELHTDHLESHFMPRPGVRWNALAAVQAHDAQVAAAGITTVLDALRVGMDADAVTLARDMETLAGAIETAKADDRLRADHLIHLRCEVSSAAVVDEMRPFVGDANLKLVSVMDHTPGQRQFRTMDAYRRYYQGKYGLSDEAFDALVRRRQEEGARYADTNRRAIVALCRAQGIVLASHDDASAEHVAESVADGCAIAEFPTTVEAAEASRAAGLAVLMGGPNVVRGGSHSGNVSAVALGRAGLLDILSSDYVPASLLHAAFDLPRRAEIALPEAVRLVTKNPAEAVGLTDRGEIAIGRRADLVRVTPLGDVPVVRSVWREGVRVA